MDIYDITSLKYETNCGTCSARRWDQLMEGAVRANVYKINKLIRKHCPDMAHNLFLWDKSLKDLMWYNPYNYYRTKTHFIAVNSCIEYFFKFK